MNVLTHAMCISNRCFQLRAQSQSYRDCSSSSILACVDIREADILAWADATALSESTLAACASEAAFLCLSTSALRLSTCVIVQHATEAMLWYNHQQVVPAAFTACLQHCLRLHGDRRVMFGQQGHPFMSGQPAKFNVA